MLAIVKPSPLRLWGFLLTALGGALVAFGSIASWAAVSLGGSTVNAVPTKGIDLWQGTLTVIAGALIVVGILALRFVRPGRRTAVAIGITALAVVALAVAVWALSSLASIVHDSGVDGLVQLVERQLGLSSAQARRQVLRAMGLEGIDVKAQVGLWMAVVGSVLAVAGGFVDLAWVRQKRRAGDAIDPDTLSAPSGPDV